MKEVLMNGWNSLGGDFWIFLERLLTSLLIVIAGKIIVHIARKIINRAVAGKLKFDETLAALIKTTVSYAAVIICMIMILDVFGINTTSLIAMLGAAGVAVGLALKDTLSNIAAGIVIILQNSCRKGDFIEFGGTSGTVKEINLFTTILETPDGIFISAPNSSVWGTPLKNYTKTGRRRMDLTVGISYGDSIEAAFGVMRGIIAREGRFSKEPPPQILVQSLGDSSVNITLRAWASGNDYWQLYWDQTRNIKEQFDAAGLHIPFNQMEVTVKKGAS